MISNIQSIRFLLRVPPPCPAIFHAAAIKIKKTLMHFTFSFHFFVSDCCYLVFVWSFHVCYWIWIAHAPLPLPYQPGLCWFTGRVFDDFIRLKQWNRGSRLRPSSVSNAREMNARGNWKRKLGDWLLVEWNLPIRLVSGYCGFGDFRLASARHRRALREKEERDAELQRQRVAYETQTRRRQMQHTAHLMAMCKEKLAQTAADQWQSKQVQSAMNKFISRSMMLTICEMNSYRLISMISMRQSNHK